MVQPPDDVAAELASFADIDYAALPPIAHYWSARYVLPLLQAVGAEGLNELWIDHVKDQCTRTAPRSARFVSLGCGDAALELSLVVWLAGMSFHNFHVELLDGNATLLERSLAEAERLGIGDRVHATCTDLNSWVAEDPADIYYAGHSLHHVVELEHLYDEVLRSLDADGVFLVNDMIGRNGHQRWPEALDVINRIWPTLDDRIRFNHSEKQIDHIYPDFDCSAVRFEGVRSQDVLPLLLDRFHPQEFVAFGNVADPFVDRIYGWNLDPADPADCQFVDKLAVFDEAAIELGFLSPTHLIATFRPQPVAARYPGTRAPAHMVRSPPVEPIPGSCSGSARRCT